MVRHISKWWWLIMAWLLAMFGKEFWCLNAAEWFASLAIIIGVIWTYSRWRNERKRKLNLIDFPEWKAYRRKNQDILELQIVTEVFIPHHAFVCKPHTEIEGEITKMQFSKPLNVPNNRSKWIVEGKAPLTPISKQAKSIEVSVEIELDGEVKKSSGKRTVAIADA